VTPGRSALVLSGGGAWLVADLASYLLFDREYAGELLALGYADAARQRDALAEFFGAPAAARSA
jgi:hypothetical protein